MHHRLRAFAITSGRSLFDCGRHCVHAEVEGKPPGVPCDGCYKTDDGIETFLEQNGIVDSGFYLKLIYRAFRLESTSAPLTYQESLLVKMLERGRQLAKNNLELREQHRLHRTAQK